MPKINCLNLLSLEMIDVSTDNAYAYCLIIWIWEEQLPSPSDSIWPFPALGPRWGDYWYTRLVSKPTTYFNGFSWIFINFNGF